MAVKRTQSEAATLERYRVALENAETQSEIATIMAEFGYDAAMIEEGKNLFTQTRQAYDNNVQEDDETSQAYSNFTEKRNSLADTYSLHRKKAKVVFKNDPVILKRLVLDGSVPAAYVSWLEIVKKFYAEMLSDTALQTKLRLLKKKWEIKLLQKINKKRVIAYSSIDWVKHMALLLGWDGEKDTKGRQFLSDIKAACTKYADIPFKKITKTIKVYYEVYAITPKYCCVNIRETSEIQKLVGWCAKANIPCHTVWIRNKKAEIKFFILILTQTKITTSSLVNKDIHNDDNLLLTLLCWSLIHENVYTVIIKN